MAKMAPQMTAHPYYPGLDIVRFLAACLVVAIHYEGHYAWFGWAGVEIFFVISGLVIANSASVETASIFLTRRILRLYPAVWICTSLALVALLLFRTYGQTTAMFPELGDIAGLTTRALFLRYVFSLALLPKVALLDSVFWTLPVEMAFYCAIFVMLLGRQISRLPTLACFLTFYSGLYVLLKLLPQLDSGFPQLVPAFVTSHVVMTQLLLMQHGCVFATGLWIYLLSRRFSGLRLAGLLFAVVFSMGEILLQASFYKAEGMYFMTGPWAQIAIWIAGLVIICFSLRRPGTNRQRNGWTRRLGLMTYPLYLVHDAMGVTLIYFLIQFGFSRNFGTFAAVLLSLGIAYLVCTFGEPAIRKWLRPWLAKERAQPSAA